jgi:hypothetical protein
MVMTVGSSSLRGLQSVNVDKLAASASSFKISGVSQLLQILNSASDYTNAAFDVITLDSFSQSITDQGVVYEGKVTLANDQGVNVTGLINGVWDPVNNKIVLTASKYEVDTEGSDTEGEGEDSGESDDNSDDGTNNTTADGYTILDIEAAKNDSNIAAAFEFSAKALIEKGERQNKIPLADYAVTEWSYASYKNKTNGVYYKFVAKLLGDNYVHVDTNMTTFRYNNQSLLLAGYYYHAYNISKGSLPNNFTDVDNNSTDVNNGTNSTIGDNNSTDVNNNSTDINNGTNSTIGDNNSTDVNNNSTDINNGTNSTNSTNSTNTTTPAPAVPAGYTYISPEDLANNTLAQNALAFGANALVQKAISQYKVPAASPEYNVTNLILAAYKNISTGKSFIFYTNLTNALNYKVDANLTITYRASNQTYKLVGYSFRSYGYPASAIVIPQNNTSNNTNSTVPDNSTQPIDNSTVPDNSTQPADNSTVIDPNNSTQPVDNSTLPVDNSTVPDNSTQPADNSTVIVPDNSTLPVDNSTVPDNSTQPIDNNSTTNNTAPVNNTAPQVTADGYTILSADKLAQDSLAQAALKYGADALIQKALSQNKIPAANANYTINNVVLASYKKQVIGTSYKFTVNMTNIDYVHVDANLTVFYRYSTKANSLNGYAFRSYNYSSKALSNNNSSTVVPPVSNTTSPSNSTVIAPVDNSTVIDSGAAAPADNSTVIEPVAPVAADNSTVVDNASSGSR